MQRAVSAITSMIIPTTGAIVEEATPPQLGQDLLAVAPGEALHDDGHVVAIHDG